MWSSGVGYGPSPPPLSPPPPYLAPHHTTQSAWGNCCWPPGHHPLPPPHTQTPLVRLCLSSPPPHTHTLRLLLAPKAPPRTHTLRSQLAPKALRSPCSKAPREARRLATAPAKRYSPPHLCGGEHRGLKGSGHGKGKQGTDCGQGLLAGKQTALWHTHIHTHSCPLMSRQ